jgi:hypothetical protein
MMTPPTTHAVSAHDIWDATQPRRDDCRFSDEEERRYDSYGFASSQTTVS